MLLLPKLLIWAQRLPAHGAHSDVVRGVVVRNQGTQDVSPRLKDIMMEREDVAECSAASESVHILH
eukprot:CAMPEP_0178456760 /NCGR_PEP_ID=MMETSP0689_2-20121128/46653_1 /TAXON_ID=160604 /ORGANISM="Amphidinium massartii, Strain CS-259" /LENGTH=65 /DNA_ID=CAMNT_0020082961 /DNA_START=34 /DNA_END=231 /DNA_ORIENTATION=+